MVWWVEISPEREEFTLCLCCVVERFLLLQSYYIGTHYYIYLYTSAGRVSGGRGLEQGVGGGSFGYMLEKEMRFEDDYSPSSPRLTSHVHAYPNSLTHTREVPLSK